MTVVWKPIIAHQRLNRLRILIFASDENAFFLFFFFVITMGLWNSMFLQYFVVLFLIFIDWLPCIFFQFWIPLKKLKRSCSSLICGKNTLFLMFFFSFFLFSERKWIEWNRVTFPGSWGWKTSRWSRRTKVRNCRNCRKCYFWFALACNKKKNNSKTIKCIKWRNYNVIGHK